MVTSETEIALIKQRLLALEEDNRDMSEQIKEINREIKKASYWFISVITTILGTFVVDKFF
jgi:hypothetical protein